MIDDPFYKELLEQAWRRNLTALEEVQLRAWLASHPEAQEDWEQEMRLNSALVRLQDVPVPSNFTARVVQELARDVARGERGIQPRTWSWRGWKRWATACTAIIAIGLLVNLHNRENQREQWRRSLIAVSGVATLPNPEILTNFDVICALDRTPPPDEELLKALQ